MTEAPPCGWMAGRVHHYSLRVFYADTDAAGMVHHSVYLCYAERARTEMMRLNDLDHLRLRDDDVVVFAVRDCRLDFRRPALLDDVLALRSTVIASSGATMTVRQDVLRGHEILARMDIRLACINGEGRPVRMPARLRRCVDGLLLQEGV